MAKVFLTQRKITLNNISGVPYHTGSTFLVEYSTDYVNFYTTSLDMIRQSGSFYENPFTSSLVDWNTISLPNVGATASVLIPENSVAMRLTDLQYPTSQYTEYI